MKLLIKGKHSSRECNFNYGAMHRVRELAYYLCNVEEEVCKVIESCSCGYRKNLIPEGLLRSISLKDLDNIAATGFNFPQILFHSDCSGGYTKDGILLETESCTTGNIYSLFHELTNMQKLLDDKRGEFVLERFKIFKEFFDLVHDEVAYEDPEIYFKM